jgi:hypothetical protein
VGKRRAGPSTHFSRLYQVLLQAAWAEGIGPDKLPDFLTLEHGGELALLGQEELTLSVVEEAMREVITRMTAGGDWQERETEQIVLGAVRVGRTFSPGTCSAPAPTGASSAALARPDSAARSCFWQGTSSRGMTAPPASGSTRETGWPPARRTMSPSTPACSPSTAGCGFT